MRDFVSNSAECLKQNWTSKSVVEVIEVFVNMF